MITHYISIHAPYGELILSGKKDIETRLRRIPERFIGKRIGIYEPERGILIGSVKVLGQKLYATAAAFRKDQGRHLVAAGSEYDIPAGGTKIGIIVGSPRRDVFGQRPKKFAPSTIVKNNPMDYGAVVVRNPAVVLKGENYTQIAVKALNDLIKNNGWIYLGSQFFYKEYPEGGVWLELSAWSEGINFAHIKTKVRGKGLASRALKELTDLADKYRLPITAIIKPTDKAGLKKGELAAWYKRYGFARRPYIMEPTKLSDSIIRKPVSLNPKDACYHKVKARYKVWPSAYASGALVQCRKVGAGNWGVRKNPDFGLEKKYGLHGWFMRNRGKGWVDCKTGLPCGRASGEKRKYPACRPTKAMCSSAMRKKKGRRRISWNPVPPAAVAKAACRGLEKRRRYGRGGTAVGVARARDLCRRANVSERTLRRMHSYFSRHRASVAESAKRVSDPTSAAAIADDLWGGTAGMRWARKNR